jgi:hypothetical protein
MCNLPLGRFFHRPQIQRPKREQQPGDGLYSGSEKNEMLALLSDGLPSEQRWLGRLNRLWDALHLNRGREHD